MNSDSAEPYEGHAQEFLRIRDDSRIGADVVARWARSLGPGTDVLEIACGGGLPITRALVDAGLRVWAIDSSPTLVSVFRVRFPDVPVQCARVQDSDCFGRRFAAVLSIGLIFLLEEDEQIALIRRAAELLLPAGRFLFSAPLERGDWKDLTTGQRSESLGQERYEMALRASGFSSVERYADEGGNNYYDAERAPSA